MLLSALGVVPAWMLANPHSATVPVISLGIFGILLTAYAVSRTEHYRVGAFLLISLMPVIVVLILMITSDPTDERLLVLNVLFIMIVIASLILSIRSTIAIAVFGLAFIAGIFYLLHVSLYTAFSYLATMAGLAALIVVGAEMRKRYAQRLSQSQQRLDAFFAQSLDGIYFMMLDVPLHWNADINKDTELDYIFAHQRITRANDAILVQYGKSREQFLGMTPNDLFAHDLPLGNKLWRQLFDDGRLHTETQLHRADGAVLWVEMDHVCFYDAEGRITGHFGVQRDITKRKEAEADLRSADLRYRALFEQSHDAVFILNLEGKHIQTNQRSASLFGYTKEELQKLSVDELSAERDESNAVRERMLRGEHIPTFQRRFYKKNGEIIPVEINVEVVRDTNGTPMHIQSVVRDITERLRAEETLRATEARQRALLEAIPDLMFRMASDGTYVDFHAPNPDHLIVPPEQFLGRKVTEVLPAELADYQMDLIEKVIRTEEQATYEYSTSIKGKTMYFEARMVVCAPDEVLVIVRDVTERKMVEQALQQSEARFSAAFRNSPVPMVLSTSDSQDSRYVEANQAYLDLVGYKWEELTGQSLVNMGIAIPSEQRNVRLNLLDNLGRYQTQEAQLRNRTGDIFDVIIWAERIQFGTENYDLEIILDVTERRKLQEQQFALAIEKERVKVLNQFVQNSSHEFRTPLAIINTNLYLIEKLEDRATQHRYIAQSKLQIRRLDQLLETMQTMTDLDIGAHFRQSAVNINELVQEVARDIQLELRPKDLTLEIGLAQSPLTISADRRWLKVALEQLLDNAIHFSTVGGTIILRAKQTEYTVAIEVRDTGIGIDKDALPHIFKRFWRQDEAHSTPGFGLGLPMVQKIIERHQGKLEVESEVTKGSTFRIVLPI
ncbi:MAG: PAS domain S-box protein [Anaerolineae bacterium]|nr:PAS domain S-box protein [Anaerolineae bacterium]